ncbi:hypothetical protein JHW43_000256 [Diplocarpon mali]|nr:hypothetical protein JHW43_000256 [Diplocarpon mali]
MKHHLPQCHLALPDPPSTPRRWEDWRRSARPGDPTADHKNTADNAAATVHGGVSRRRFCRSARDAAKVLCGPPRRQRLPSRLAALQVETPHTPLEHGTVQKKGVDDGSCTETWYLAATQVWLSGKATVLDTSSRTGKEVLCTGRFGFGGRRHDLSFTRATSHREVAMCETIGGAIGGAIDAMPHPRDLGTASKANVEKAPCPSATGLGHHAMALPFGTSRDGHDPRASGDTGTPGHRHTGTPHDTTDTVRPQPSASAIGHQSSVNMPPPTATCHPTEAPIESESESSPPARVGARKCSSRDRDTCTPLHARRRPSPPARSPRPTPSAARNATGAPPHEIAHPPYLVQLGWRARRAHLPPPPLPSECALAVPCLLICARADWEGDMHAPPLATELTPRSLGNKALHLPVVPSPLPPPHIRPSLLTVTGETPRYATVRYDAMRHVTARHAWQYGPRSEHGRDADDTPLAPSAGNRKARGGERRRPGTGCHINQEAGEGADQKPWVRRDQAVAVAVAVAAATHAHTQPWEGGAARGRPGVERAANLMASASEAHAGREGFLDFSGRPTADLVSTYFARHSPAKALASGYLCPARSIRYVYPGTPTPNSKSQVCRRRMEAVSQTSQTARASER